MNAMILIKTDVLMAASKNEVALDYNKLFNINASIFDVLVLYSFLPFLLVVIVIKKKSGLHIEQAIFDFFFPCSDTSE